MTQLERLRLAIALVHSTPGAQLHLDCTTGERVVVGAHPAADIDACKMRQIVAGITERLATHLERLAEIEFGGSLEDLGGGVFGIRQPGVERRAIVTFVTPERLIELIATLDDVEDTNVEVTIRPDGAVGVTVIELRAPQGRFGEVDDIAARVTAMCFVEEVVVLAQREVGGAGGAVDVDAARVLRRARPWRDA